MDDPFTSDNGEMFQRKRVGQGSDIAGNLVFAGLVVVGMVVVSLAAWFGWNWWVVVCVTGAVAVAAALMWLLIIKPRRSRASRP